MSIYGRLRRKPPVVNKTLFSPTKHKVEEITSSSTDLSSISANSFSSTSSLESFHTNEKDCNSDQYYSTQSKRTAAMSLRSPVKKSRLSFYPRSAFKGFEELENEEIGQSPHSEPSENPLKTARKTTLFSKISICESQTDEESAKESTTENKPRNVDFSDDEFAVELSSTLKTLNTRLKKLQSDAVNEKDTNNTNEESEPVASTGFPSGLKTYGNVRSIKVEEKSLSDEENDSDGAINQNDYIYSTATKSTTQSSVELRVSGELESCKLEFEMIIEQFEDWIDQGRSDFLQLKLDLTIKIQKDLKFESYLRNYIVNTSNRRVRTVLLHIVTHDTKIPILDLHLIGFFKLPIIYAYLHIITLSNADDVPIRDYITENCKFQKKITSYLVDDWLLKYSTVSVYSAILNTLLAVDITDFGKLETQKRDTILKFTKSCMMLEDRMKSSIAIQVLKRFLPKVCAADAATLIEDIMQVFLNTPHGDVYKTNSILECLITASDLFEEKQVQNLLFSKIAWNKLWCIAQSANTLGNKSLNDLEEKQWLFALGYLFGFINQDYSITEESQLEIMRGIISLPVLNKSTYSTVELHGYGYLGTVAYHFLQKFGCLNTEESLQLEKLCQIFKSNNTEPNNRLTDYVYSVLEKL